MKPVPTLRCPCGDAHLTPAFEYDAPPQGETAFDLRGQAYARRYDECRVCGHWFGRHALDLSGLYGADYVDATYGGPDGMRERFERVMALPDAQSDNRARTRRVLEFARGLGIDAGALLDVGAGLGVFPAAMRAAGWRVTALEPDPRTVAHLRAVAGVDATATDLAALPADGPRFDLVTFNKVLEHVEDPVALLAHAGRLLAPGGFVYVELPDVAAAQDGPGREEFFVEHHHVFSPASIAMLCARAGLPLARTLRLREPSGKFTLCAFAVAAPSHSSSGSTVSA
jgi:SAM-dependent methyltransferase